MGRFDCIVCFCVTGNTERNFRGCIIRCVPNEWLQNYSKNNVYRSNRRRSGGIESCYLLHFHNCCSASQGNDGDITGPNGISLDQIFLRHIYNKKLHLDTTL